MNKQQKTKEERRIQEQQRHEERRKTEERHQSEYQQQQEIRQAERLREQNAQQIHETTVRNFSKNSDEEKQLTEARKDGKAIINGNAIVADYYRNLNASRHEERPTSIEHDKSPAMEKYLEYEKSMSGKVERHIKEQQQTHEQGHER